MSFSPQYAHFTKFCNETLGDSVKIKLPFTICHPRNTKKGNEKTKKALPLEPYKSSKDTVKLVKKVKSKTANLEDPATIIHPHARDFSFKAFSHLFLSLAFQSHSFFSL